MRSITEESPLNCPIFRSNFCCDRLEVTVASILIGKKGNLKSKVS